MIAQTKWDIGDVVLSPLDSSKSSITGVRITNVNGKYEETYLLNKDFVWYNLNELLEVNDGKQI